MSEPALSPTAPPAAPPAPSPTAAPATAKSSNRPLIVGIVGGVLVAAAVGLTLMQAGIDTGPGNADRPTLSFVDQKDITDAAVTLTPSAAGALVDEAKRCNVPLATVTITKGTAAAGSTLRIRSGSYVSPFFTVTDAPQRVAVPYPAPFGAGAGTLTVEGSANGAILGLAPAKVIVSHPGSQSLPVVWRARKPC
jgi:hypothetical protein